MKTAKTIPVDFTPNTNGVFDVSESGFYDTVRDVRCYSSAEAVTSWTGSTGARIELYDSGSIVTTLPSPKFVNDGPEYEGLGIPFSGKLEIRWFHNQNAYVTPSVKTCSVTVEPSNWFAQIAYSDGMTSFAYFGMVMVFTLVGAMIGKYVSNRRNRTVTRP